jgi:glycosyltransferase involved in cell wall biosynthesis
MGDPADSLHLAVYSDALLYGGAEQSLGNLLAELPDDYEISILGVDPVVLDKIAVRRADARVVELPYVASKWHVGAIRKHVAAVRGLRPDVLHANLWTPWSGQYGIFAGLVTPGVGTVAVEQLPLASNSPSQRWIKRTASRRLDAHVAVGERAARSIEEMVGLRPGAVRAIYNGVPEVPVERARPSSEQPVIGSLGRLDSQKGYDVLLRALVEVPRARVVIVGDGPERGRLERLASELGVADRFEILGWRDDARRFLGGFDIFTLPSRYEGFPLSIVEAMLARTPVVASNVASIPEAVEHGHTGLLVPPDDPSALAAALQKVLDMEDRGLSLADAAQARARERFTATVMAQRFVDLYREVTAGP